MANTPERSFEGLAPEPSHGIEDGFDIGGKKYRLIAVFQLMYHIKNDRRSTAGLPT
ncbi:MAG: hypothetical protein ACYCXP_13150 [Leptospirillum sp.]